MRIVVSGVIVQFPYAGMAWHYLNWLMGLKALGHRVHYFEDASRLSGLYLHESTRHHGINFAQGILDSHGFGGLWSVLDPRGERHGLDRAAWKRVCRGADLFLNLSGSCEIKGDIEGIPLKAYVDTDPGLAQARISRGDARLSRLLSMHQAHFTYGESLSFPTLGVSSGGFAWKPVRQPVFLKAWPAAPESAHRGVFTTVMNWRSYRGVRHRGRLFGTKDVEFKRFWDLPSRTVQPLCVALGVSGVRNAKAVFLRLHEKGWRVLNATLPTYDTRNYRHFIRTSKAEFTVAKNLYVRLKTGWFSERSACYLASARPVLMQDTGLASILPVGRGLLTFRNPDEAAEGIARINRDYRFHSRAARAWAEEHLDSRKVLGRFLGDLGS